MRPSLATFVLLFSMVVLAGRAAAQEQDLVSPRGSQPLLDVPADIARRYGDQLRGFRAVDACHLAELFPGRTLHEATCHNPGSEIAGASFRVEGVLEQEGTYRFLSNDDEATALLSEVGGAVADLPAAIVRCLAFAEARRYVPRLNGPELTDEAARPLGWRLTAEEKDDGWEISCVLRPDSEHDVCHRYTIHVTPAGKVTVLERTHVWSCGGYR